MLIRIATRLQEQLPKRSLQLSRILRCSPSAPSKCDHFHCAAATAITRRGGAGSFPNLIIHQDSYELLNAEDMAFRTILTTSMCCYHILHVILQALRITSYECWWPSQSMPNQETYESQIHCVGMLFPPLLSTLTLTGQYYHLNAILQAYILLLYIKEARS